MSSAALRPPPADDLYETDLYLWTRAQAALLRAALRRTRSRESGRGGGERGRARDARDRAPPRRLIGHLLKREYQPGGRSSGWVGTITEQRQRLDDLLEMSPSLHGHPARVFARCHLSGRLLASKDTGIDVTLFPEAAPFTVEQALDLDHLPAEPGRLDQV